jgi:cytochrome c oxidase cbb3-type subunit IV
MDIGTIHSIWTIVIFISFIGVCWWAFGKNRKNRFDEDANLIFADEPSDASAHEEKGVTK